MTSPRDEIRAAADAAIAAAAEDEQDQGPAELGDGEPYLYDNCPVVPLGVAGRIRFFLDERRQLVSLEPQEIGRANIVGLWGERYHELYDRYPRISKENAVVGFRPEIAQERLIAAANACGVWNPAKRQRGRGAWKGDEGELVLHCGDRVIVIPPGTDGWAKRIEHQCGVVDGYVYPGDERVPLPAAEVTTKGGPGAELLTLLNTWKWRRGVVDARLLLGWIGASILGGALAWRPLIWITGGRGTGKSTLHEVVRYVLDQALLQISDASAAGIWQTLEHSTLPVAFDELEAEEDNRRQAAIVKLARQAASGGLILRGGADHKAAEFIARSCFMFSSILMPPLMGQDRSRLAILELGELPRDRAAPALDAKKWRKVGLELRRRLVDGWHRFPRTLEFYRSSLSALGHSARGCDQFGTLLACADLLLLDGDPDSDLADEWIGSMEVANLAESEDDVRDEERALSHLMTSVVDSFKNGARRSLAQWARQAGDEAKGADDDGPEVANGMLGTYGLKVIVDRHSPGDVKRWLAIANYHQGLAKLFEGTHWAGKSGAQGVWVQAFRRLPGAERSSGAVWFAGAVARATLVPLALAIPKEERT